MNQTPLLPITADSGIVSTYVDLDPQDVFYTNLKTEKQFSLTGWFNIFLQFPAIKCDSTGSNSAYWNVMNLMLYERGYEESLTSLTADYMNILAIDKNRYGDSIKEGTFSVTSGTIFPDPKPIFYDSGSGQLVRKDTGKAYGNVLLDEGIAAVSGFYDLAHYPGGKDERSPILNFVFFTGISFQPKVYQNTLNVFCRCNPDQLNYSLNPTAFEADSVGDWMKEPFTASTSASTFRSDFTSSGISWQPTITSVGLYNDENELLVIAKMPRPLKKSTDIPMTFHIRIDI